MNNLYPLYSECRKQLQEKAISPLKLVKNDTEEEWVSFSRTPTIMTTALVWVEVGKRRKEDRHWQELGRKVWKDSRMLSMYQKFTELAVLV